MFAQHILLSKFVAEASPTDWKVIDLTARSYQPQTDQKSELDWQQLADALGEALSFQQPTQAVPAEDPDWLRKQPTPKEVTDFPQIQTTNV
jgi:hypothetical protein